LTNKKPIYTDAKFGFENAHLGDSIIAIPLCDLLQTFIPEMNCLPTG